MTELLIALWIIAGILTILLKVSTTPNYRSHLSAYLRRRELIAVVPTIMATAINIAIAIAFWPIFLVVILISYKERKKWQRQQPVLIVLDSTKRRNERKLSNY